MTFGKENLGLEGPKGICQKQVWQYILYALVHVHELAVV